MNMAKVVYWSQTGNTQTMAEAVAKGITAAGGGMCCGIGYYTTGFSG